MSSNYTILTGRIWKEHGSKKLILTLNGARAGALEAAIPLWISLVGPLTWIVIQYVWFQCSTLRGPRKHPFRPLYYRQKQVLLRNSSGDLGTVSNSFALFLSWWKIGEWKAKAFLNAFWRTSPLGLTALLFWSVWQVLAIVSFTYGSRHLQMLGWCEAGFVATISFKDLGQSSNFGAADS